MTVVHVSKACGSSWKLANTSNRGRVCLSIMLGNFKFDKCSVQVSTSFTSLLLGEMTSTVATALRKITTITSTHNLPLLSLRSTVLHFLWSKINKPNRYFLYWKILSLVAPDKPRDVTFIPSALIRAQRWRVSWIRSMLGGRCNPLTYETHFP